MDKNIKHMTEPAQRAMHGALLEAKKSGREALIPPDVFRVLAEMSEGRHLRVLVDVLRVDLAQLREAVAAWEFKEEPKTDWNYQILLFATMEADVATRAYVSTEHLLLSLVHLWPQAPCSQVILRAAGGTMSGVRYRMTASW